MTKTFLEWALPSALALAVTGWIIWAIGSVIWESLEKLTIVMK